jgi:PhnB protein
MLRTTKNRVIEPYLSFNGRCEEAVNFYQKAPGAEVAMMMRFKESPVPPPPEHPTPPN